MPTYKSLAILAAALMVLVLRPLSAAPLETNTQNLKDIQSFASAYLLQKLGEHEGKASAEVTPLDPRLKLTKCSDMRAELTAGSSLIGRPSISVSCTHPEIWNVFITGKTSLFAKYVVAARSISPGIAIQEQDLTYAEGDLAKLPPKVARNGLQLIGLASVRPIRKGDSLRTDSVVQPVAFQAGQQVKLIAISSGFSVSGTATAINTARIGSLGEARTANGQRVSGVATSLGVLEIKI